MIIREWRGRASLNDLERYPVHFRTTVVPELRRLPGFVGAHLSRRLLGDRIEFLVLTRWKSMDAIRDFAGSEVALTRRRNGWVQILALGARRNVAEARKPAVPSKDRPRR